MGGLRDVRHAYASRKLIRAAALTAAAAAFAASAAAAPGEIVWTVAGNGGRAVSGDGGHARDAALDQPRAVSALPGGGFAWAEPYSHRARLVDADGVASLLAGTGEPGFSGDGGKATEARVNFVHAAVPTADGGFLLADTLNHRIRKVSSGGIITTVAGNGDAEYRGDGGLAKAASIRSPRSLAVLPGGGFLIADSNNHRIRKVTPGGVITTVAGNGRPGSSGDGGPATNAGLNTPFAVAPTPDGGFLIADMGNQRIRKVGADGLIATVAGNGIQGYAGDGGPATAARLSDPHNVLALPDGSFLVADTSNERIRRVGADGIITTLVGVGVRGDAGDGGAPSAAYLAAPKGLDVTPEGNLLIADEQNNRIRFVGNVVGPSNATPPTIAGDPVPGRLLRASAGTWRGTGPMLTYQWQRCVGLACSEVAGATSNLYAVTRADDGLRLRVVVTAVNPAGSATASSAATAAAGTIGGSGGPRPSGGPGSGPGPGGAPGPASRLLDWQVRVGKTFQRAGELTLRPGRERLSDAIRAYGAAACRRESTGRLVATWRSRGIRVELASRAGGCAAPGAARIAEVRLTDPRWSTSLGLHVGDSAATLRRLYPRAPLVRAGGAVRYRLAWRREACLGCASGGVNVGRLVADVVRGRVVALSLPVGR